MRRTHRVESWSLILFVVGSLCIATASFAVDFGTIERAWRERERLTHTISIKWSESRVNTAPKSVDEPRPQQPVQQVLQDVPDMAVFFKDKMARLEGMINAQSADEVVGKNIGTRGSADARDLFFVGSRSFGTILVDGRPAFAGQMNAWPALLLYRGCSDSIFYCPLSVFGPPSGVLREGKDGTLVLSTSARHEGLAPMDWTLVLQAAAAYAPLQLTGKVNGKTCFDLRLKLDRPRDGIPIPKSWSVSMLTQHGQLMGNARAKVTSCVVGEILDDSFFELKFPEGTLVTDMRPTAKGNKERRFKVVDGGEREVDDAELLRGASAK